MFRKIAPVIIAVIIVLLVFPVLFNAQTPFCAIASAQNNPCLSQDATISALKLENLELVATMGAQELNLAALRLQPVVITVPVIITATPSEPMVIYGFPMPTAIPTYVDRASFLPPECVLYTVVEGDTPFGIAAQYGIDDFLLLKTNQLTEDTAAALETGDTLIIPLAGCPAAQVQHILTGALPTLVPTAANSQITLVSLEGQGDVTEEGVRIRNTGNTINVTGWRLTDQDGNLYTFGAMLIFSNTEVTVYTRTGQNTPIALFWGLDNAIWENDDVITLADARGQVQATRYVSDMPASGQN